MYNLSFYLIKWLRRMIQNVSDNPYFDLDLIQLLYKLNVKRLIDT